MSGAGKTMIGVRSNITKGMIDLHTATGKVRPGHLRYQSYYQIGALELERLRKQQERDVASRRIACIDERLAEIDRKIAAIRHNMAGGAECDATMDEQRPVAIRGGGRSNDVPADGGGGIRLRY